MDLTRLRVREQAARAELMLGDETIAHNDNPEPLRRLAACCMELIRRYEQLHHAVTGPM